METEQGRTLEALRTAIQMEIDGKKFYLEASRESGNKLGKKLLRTLAAEEDLHRQKFSEIYDAVRRKNAWPVTDFQPDGGKHLRTVFATVVGEAGYSKQDAATELSAVKTAIGMESKTYDFYKARAGSAAYDIERGFYEAIAAEEREHHLVLLDYYEYLKDPAAWFVLKEHPSLDGG